MVARSAAAEQTDQEIARQLCERLEYGGRLFHPGQYVAILDGKVVAVADSFEEADQSLSALEPDPRRGLVCLIEPPEPDVIR